VKTFEKLLLENKAWAAEQLLDDPGYFNKLSKIQTPEFLWIGCSDSRVPANQITGTIPGEVFVHRNIANLVVEDDLNLLSVLHYAVNYLKVKNIIVCGHYGCGGVKAALGDGTYGILDRWLINLKRVRDENHDYIFSLPEGEEQENALSELSVKQQVHNLMNTTIIRDAWEAEQRPSIHGWIYGLKDGLLKPLILKEPEPVEAEYKLM